LFENYTKIVPGIGAIFVFKIWFIITSAGIWDNVVMFRLIISNKNKVVLCLGLIIVAALSHWLEINLETKAVFLDVGQGDATLLITSDGKTILVDGGPDNLLLRRLSQYLPYWQRRIDYILVSHFHDDHITGLIEVLRRYEVGEIIYANKLDSDITLILERTAQEMSVPIRQTTKETKIKFSEDCYMLLISPESLISSHDDNDSLITYFSCNSLSVLLTGDNRQAVEESLIKTWSNVKADVLKAGHHGSKTASSESFMHSVSPEFMVISVGEGNRFGHPHQDTIDRAKRLDIKIFRTDFFGNIVIRDDK